MLVMSGIISVVLVFLVLRWYYCRKLDVQIKLLKIRLNRIINAERKKAQVVDKLLKEIYTLINKGLNTNNSIVIYQALDLLKLAFGYGLVRTREASNLMRICVIAMNTNKPDIVGFALDVFRPLVRQLSVEEIVSVVDQLTLIGAIALKRKHNFLAAKVMECIFFVMEQSQENARHSIIVASIRSLKVIGVLALRRRDMALFREINMRLLSLMKDEQGSIADEIARMLSAWLFRIVRINDLALFVILTDLTKNMLDARVLTSDAFELLIDEWGDIAAMACLNPNSKMAGLIIEFMFNVANTLTLDKPWKKVVIVAGRVAKLAVDRHGLISAFLVLHPIMETGRNLLAMEMKFAEYIDEIQQQKLFRVVRECLIILTYATKRNLLDSTGDLIIELFTQWIVYPPNIGNQQSIKKYCQLLLLSWLKNKKNEKRYIPRNVESMGPMLFSSLEKQRLGL